MMCIKINILVLACFCIFSSIVTSCTKSEYQDVLKTKYEASVNDSEVVKDFTVQLKARALQPKEKGDWKIISGNVMDKFVYIEDSKNPFSTFTGLPGETYVLEWTVVHADNTISKAESQITIPDFDIAITEFTPSGYQTIRHFQVEDRYKDIGSWSVDKPIGRLFSRYHDGSSRPVEKNPTIQVHGYENTDYIVSFTTSYAGKSYTFSKSYRTGVYQQSEAIRELQFDESSNKIIRNHLGNIIELSLQSEGIAWILEHPETYPALKALKHLRRLNLGSSSVTSIPQILGDHYLELEHLFMDRIGKHLTFPSNFGNLSKLKTILLSPRYSADDGYVMSMPNSFGNLKSLESLSIRHAGKVNFNATLGGLTNLKHLDCFVTHIPENIGNLKNLKRVDLYNFSSSFPEPIGDCSSLSKLNIIFNTSDVVSIPTKIGNLSNLDTLNVTASKVSNIPVTIGKLQKLKVLKVENQYLSSVPSSIGDLSNLVSFEVYGTYTQLPSSIGKLKNLKYLYLSHTVTSLPEEFGDLEALEYLNLESSRLKALPSTFGKLKKLVEIAGRSCSLESLPDSFSELDALGKIDFSYAKFSKFPPQLTALKGINTITLNGTTLGDLPNSIYDMKSGVYFSIYNCKDINVEQIRQLVRSRQGLLFIYEYGYIT